MLGISKEDLVRNLIEDNPWWLDPTRNLAAGYTKYRAYFCAFQDLVSLWGVRRSVVLMGPRRVGKTVMLFQLIQSLIESQFPSGRIFFASLDTPAYQGMPLEELLQLYLKEKGCGPHERSVVIFDEVQYLKDWEVHLKALTDRYPNIRFIASGSAAAALKLKSRESGAGRFTDFHLPPLSFAEFLDFSDSEELVQPNLARPGFYQTDNISELNACFINYLNYGGYPETVLNPEVQKAPRRFLRQDVIDKVLLRDLPILYGIQDVQEMNRLLAFLAYHSGKEISLKSLSENSGASKNTITRYLEYLEAAFLILRVNRVTDTGKHFSRQTNFKVYLTNPAMRAALYAPLKPDDNVAIGHMAETAIFSQWFHSPQLHLLHYARWDKKEKEQEVDIVALDPNTLKPKWAYEIKWSDKYVGHANRLTGLINFAQRNNLHRVGASSKSLTGEDVIGDITITHFPCALHCYTVGRRVLADQTL